MKIFSILVLLLLSSAIIVHAEEEIKKEKSKSKSWIEVTVDTSGWGDWFQIFWQDFQGGHDVTSAKKITFYLKTVEGNVSTMAISLSDAKNGKGEPVAISEYAMIKPRWTKISIPLSAFKKVDLTDLQSIVIERGRYKHAKYGIDEISFGNDLMWGDENFHGAMQATGGTQVEYEIKKRGGK